MRLRCRIGIHCYHYDKFVTRIIKHGKPKFDKEQREIQFICCYCGKESFNPGKFGTFLTLSSIDNEYRLYPKRK